MLLTLLSVMCCVPLLRNTTINNSEVLNHFRECGKKGIFECAFALNYEQFVKYRKNRITLSFFYVYKGEECQMNGVDIF